MSTSIARPDVWSALIDCESILIEPDFIVIQQVVVLILAISTDGLVLVLVLLVSPAVFSYPLSNDADPVWHWVWSGWVISQNVRIKINYTTAEATSSMSVARDGTGQKEGRGIDAIKRVIPHQRIV